MMMTKPVEVDSEGYVHVPQGHGLVIDVNLDLIEIYTVLKK
jgi:L-alanine-DL-glutamate epimerase-like enolase superfamily enzyme